MKTWFVWINKGKWGAFRASREGVLIDQILRSQGVNVCRIKMNGFEPPLEYKDTLNLEALEKKAIIQALEDVGGCQKEAASILGLTPRALHYKIHFVHGIDPDDIGYLEKDFSGWPRSRKVPVV